MDSVNYESLFEKYSFLEIRQYRMFLGSKIKWFTWYFASTMGAYSLMYVLPGALFIGILFIIKGEVLLKYFYSWVVYLAIVYLVFVLIIYPLRVTYEKYKCIKREIEEMDKYDMEIFKSLEKKQL